MAEIAALSGIALVGALISFTLQSIDESQALDEIVLKPSEQGNDAGRQDKGHADHECHGADPIGRDRGIDSSGGNQ